MLTKVKTALRITTNALDTEIQDNIDEARAELIRAGVPSEVVEAEGALVVQAVKARVLSWMSPDIATQERYERTFLYMEDCLRKSEVIG